MPRAYWSLAGLIALSCASLPHAGVRVSPATPAAGEPAAPSAPLIQPYALTHVTLVDVQTGMALRDRTILVRDGRFARIMASRSARLPPGTAVLDLRGKWIVPGLMDAHVHLTKAPTDRALAELLASGVTTVRDVGAFASDSTTYAVGWGQVERIAGVAQQVERGDVVGPRVLYCGPGFTSSSKARSGPNDIALARSDTTDVVPERDVAYLAAAGVTCIKVYSGAIAPHIRALGRAARARGLPLIGHSAEYAPVSEQLSWGWSELHHEWIQPDELLAASALQMLPKQSLFGRMFVGWALFDPREPAARQTARRIAASGLGWVPTIAASEPNYLDWMWAVMTYGADSTDQLRIRAAILPASAAGTSAADSLAAPSRVLHEFAIRWTRLLHEAGVPLIAGSDSPVEIRGDTALMPFGKSLHRELRSLVRTGLTPLEALRAATVNTAKHIGVGDSLGVIRSGTPADFVVLDADPLQDISNLERIHAVGARGRFYFRSTLDSLTRP